MERTQTSVAEVSYFIHVFVCDLEYLPLVATTCLTSDRMNRVEDCIFRATDQMSLNSRVRFNRITSLERIRMNTKEGFCCPELSSSCYYDDFIY